MRAFQMRFMSHRLPVCRFLNTERRRNILKRDEVSSSVVVSRNSDKKQVEMSQCEYKLSEYAAELVKQYRVQLQRKSFSPGGIYILHNELADKIVGYLCPKPEEETAMVFEANPGPGILTRRILEAGVGKLRIFEKQQAFLPLLLQLNEKYPRLEIIDENLFNLSKISYADHMSGGSRTHEMLSGVKTNKWTEPPPLKIFGIAPPRQETVFLRYILAKLGELGSVFAFGRTQFLAIVSAKEHNFITATTRSGYSVYRSATVFYNIFFDVEILEVFQRELFYPPPHARQRSENKNVYLVRLTPKSDLMEKVGSRQKLQELHFFVQQNMAKRSALVIHTLEKWIPSCGPRIIGKGINIFTRFGDLEPRDIFELFLQFVSWPEFDACNFSHVALKSAHEMSELNEEDA